MAAPFFADAECAGRGARPIPHGSETEACRLKSARVGP